MREAAAVVAVPRVAASPVAIECRLHSTLELGDSTLVLGSVVHIAVDDAAFTETAAAGRLPHPQVEKLAPLARLGRDEWSTLGEIRRLARPHYPGGRSGSAPPETDRIVDV